MNERPPLASAVVTAPAYPATADRHAPGRRPGVAGRVLVALGEHPQGQECCALLRQQGYEVVRAEHAEGALREMQARAVDVVLGSAQLAGLPGLALLAQVRAVDPDVAVILLSSARDLDNAIEAMERGALRYLTRAVTTEELVALVGQGARLRRNARRRHDSMTVIRAVGPAGRAFGDAASLADAFESALSGVYLSFQPIVSCAGRAPVAYEALMRCREPRLPSPPSMLEAAEKLGRLDELGRRIRVLAADAAASLPPGARLFVNAHPRDLEDADLYDPEAPLSRQAHRVTIEVTERARLEDDHTTQVNLRRLRDLGYRVAIDDLGAGYAGLASVAVLHPEIVKVDMSLVRGVDRNPISARIIRALAAVCAEMGITLIAEGVETRAERDTLVGLGCDLLQGYLFARPGPGFAEPTSDLYPG
jgi:EAL domain-containing protein (putative c-di-GMP-specific phosphodiesterase class I)